MTWNNVGSYQSREFRCGHCGNIVATQVGFSSVTHASRRIYVCPHCDKPTYFDEGAQMPGIAPGVEVAHLPEHVKSLYREARNAASVGAYTAAVLTCRKLLMNIAVGLGARAGDTFLSYVDFLADKGYVPPNGRGWVDHIRQKSNEANHEIVLMCQGDADDLITFAEMLLKFIFEFPKRVPVKRSTM